MATVQTVAISLVASPPSAAIGGATRKPAPEAMQKSQQWTQPSNTPVGIVAVSLSHVFKRSVSFDI
jgi:hypothetical protein